jgi:hypothetical protein
MGKKSIRILSFIVVMAFLAGMVTNERSWAQETEKSTPANGGDGWRFLIAPYTPICITGWRTRQKVS